MTCFPKPFAILAVSVAVCTLAATPAAAEPVRGDEGLFGRAVALLDAPETRDPDDFWAVREPASRAWSADPETSLDLYLARFTADLEPVEERWQRIVGASPFPGSARIDRRGRLWLAAHVFVAPDGEDSENGEIFLDGGYPDLLVFAPDGDLLASRHLPGSFLGVTGSGPDRAVVEVMDEAGPRLVHVDPFTGASEVAVPFPEDEYGAPSGGCFAAPRSVRADSRGGAFWVHDYGGEERFAVVRRYAPSGSVIGRWRVPAHSGPFQGFHHAARGGDELVFAIGERVVRVGRWVEPDSWRLPAASVHQLLPRDDGVLVLLDDGRVVPLGAPGEVGPARRLDLPPAGMGYAERQRRWRRLALRALDEADSGELVEVVAQGSPERAAAARRRLVARGADAVPALLDALEDHGWTRRLTDLAQALVSADAGRTGDVFTRHLADHAATGPRPVSGAPEDRLAALLVATWENPSPAFVDLMARQLVALDFDQPFPAFHRSAEQAFGVRPLEAGDLPPGASLATGGVALRFPPPPAVVEHYAAALKPDDPEGGGRLVYPWDAGRFFLAQFAHAADLLEQRLLDRRHPDHPQTVEMVAGFVARLAEEAGGDGSAEPGPGSTHPELLRRARSWSTRPDAPPAVVRLGHLLAVALGDPASLDPLLAADEPWREEGAALGSLLGHLPTDRRGEAAVGMLGALRATASHRAARAGTGATSCGPCANHPHLGRRAPRREALPGELVPHLAAAATPELVAALVDWLAQPDLEVRLRSRLQGLLLEGPVWELVGEPSLTALVAAGHPHQLASDTDYAFADALWRRLEDADSRAALLARVAARLPADPAADLPAAPAPWLRLLQGQPATGLSSLVDTATLRRITRALPADPRGRLSWLGELALVARVRGPWPELLRELETALDGQPGALSFISPEAAGDLLGDALVDELVLAAPADR